MRLNRVFQDFDRRLFVWERGRMGASRVLSLAR